MVGSAALDGRGDDLAGAGIGLVLGALLQLLDLERGLVRHFALDLLDQVLLGVFGSKTGNAFEHFGLAALDDLDFFVFFRSYDDGDVSFFRFRYGVRSRPFPSVYPFRYRSGRVPVPVRFGTVRFRSFPSSWNAGRVLRLRSSSVPSRPAVRS